MRKNREYFVTRKKKTRKKQNSDNSQKEKVRKMIGAFFFFFFFCTISLFVFPFIKFVPIMNKSMELARRLILCPNSNCTLTVYCSFMAYRPLLHFRRLILYFYVERQVMLSVKWGDIALCCLSATQNLCL